MRGVCGKRADYGDDLNCPDNGPAPPLSSSSPDADASDLAARLRRVCPTLWAQQGGENGRYCCTAQQLDKLERDTQKAMPFVVGCPACRHNFVHLWCLATCSPDQAAFTNVTSIRRADSPPDEAHSIAVAEVQVWVAQKFADDLYASCKDVKFGAANLPAMTFIGGGAKNASAWLDFLGLVKDKRLPPVGSPFQINFSVVEGSGGAGGGGQKGGGKEGGGGGEGAPEGIAPLDADLPSCGDALLACGCADCPAAAGCSAPGGGSDDEDEDEDPTSTDGACRLFFGRARCVDVGLLLVWLAGVGAVLARAAQRRASRRARDELDVQLGDGGGGGDGDASGGLGAPLLFGFGGADEGEEEGGASEADGAADENDEAPPGDPRYPPLERALQRLFRVHGERCAREPRRPLLFALGLVLFFSLGLVRFRVETQPEKLWVGSGSRAARDRARYDSSFGPFYRVAQLIVSTTPQSTSPYDPNPADRKSVV